MMELSILHYFLVVFFLICGVLGWLIGQNRLKIKRDRFKKRENISLEEIYAQFYQGCGYSKNGFKELWMTISTTLKLDPGKLRPDDSFKANLGSVNGFPVEDELIYLEDMVIAKCNEFGIEYKHIKLYTIDDFIKFMLKNSEFKNKL